MKMINSAYNIDYKDMTITIRTIMNGKVNAQGSSVLFKFSKPSQNISAIISRTGSLVGGDTNIPYFIDLTTGTNIPSFGVIEILLPTIYQSIYGKDVECILTKYETGK